MKPSTFDINMSSQDTTSRGSCRALDSRRDSPCLLLSVDAVNAPGAQVLMGLSRPILPQEA